MVDLPAVGGVFLILMLMHGLGRYTMLSWLASIIETSKTLSSLYSWQNSRLLASMIIELLVPII